MNYSNNAGDVRVDFFKESGKWYDSVQVNMNELYEALDIHNAVFVATMATCKNSYKGMTLVCLEPYHKHAHPIMIINWDHMKRGPKGRPHDPRSTTNRHCRGVRVELVAI